MTWVDWAIIAVLVFSALISVVRGFIKEVVSLLIWIAAGAIAFIFYDQLAFLMTDWIDTPSLRKLIAWVVLFVAVLLVGSLLNYLLGKLVQATGLSGTDRLLGMLFGVARGLVILMVLLIILPKMLPMKQNPWWVESTLIPYFMQYEDWATETGTPIVEFLINLRSK